MNKELALIPMYSEDGSVVTVMVMGIEGKPIGKKELVEALRDFADIYELSEDVKN